MYCNIIELPTPVISKKSYEFQKISFLVSQKLTCLQIKDAKHASMIHVATPITYCNQRVWKSYHRLLSNCNSTLNAFYLEMCIFLWFRINIYKTCKGTWKTKWIMYQKWPKRPTPFTIHISMKPSTIKNQKPFPWL